MTTQTLTLSDFLLARIAEDEARWSHWWASGGSGVIHSNLGRQLLADCEAKRRIVEFVDGYFADEAANHELLRLLALPYADHPDYNPDWRP